NVNVHETLGSGLSRGVRWARKLLQLQERNCMQGTDVPVAQRRWWRSSDRPCGQMVAGSLRQQGSRAARRSRQTGRCQSLDGDICWATTEGVGVTRRAARGGGGGRSRLFLVEGDRA